MSAPATGELHQLADGWEARITILGRDRRCFVLVTCPKEDDARARCTAMAGIALRLRKAGRATDEIEKVLGHASKARSGRPWTAILDAVDVQCSGNVEAVDANTVPTFADFAGDWASGALRKKHPDHVAAKDSDQDKRILRLYVVPVIGTTRVDEFTLDDADRIMANLPATVGGKKKPRPMTPATRRHIAQFVRRVMALAVYPARHIKENPIPRGWLPKVKATKAFTHLHPSEDAKLLAFVEVPIARRLFYGVLAREGLRRDELARLRFRDLDLERGSIVLDENKTNDPRSWALDPGVVRALSLWKKHHRANATADDLVFELYTQHLADELRGDLERAKVDRPQLFERSETRHRIRLHDLRSTFVTVSLANGKTETWVADRTGHRSSAMLNRYRRAARTWAELRLGELTPLHVALGDLSPTPVRPLPDALPDAAESHSVENSPKSSGEKGIRTPGTLAGTPDFESGTFGHSDISPPGKFLDSDRHVKR